MKYKSLAFLAWVVIFINFTFAQSNLTINDLNNFRLYPQNFYKIQWQPNGDKIAYFDYNEYNIVIINHKNKVVKKINLLKIGDIVTTNFKWIDQNTFLFIKNNLVALYDIEKEKIIKKFTLPDNADNIFYNHQAKQVAFTVENNLYITTDSSYKPITNEKNPYIIYGDDYVHRQEFGIDHGIFWSPKGNFVAFYRDDQTSVYDYPLVDYSQFPAEAKPIKYPMAGQKSEEVTLGVYNLKTGKKLFLEKKGDPEHYLTCISWGPEEKFIYIAELNRDQNFLKLNKYDVESGKLVKTLFTEKNSKYVEPLFPLYFLPKSKDKFVWLSQRDGFWHLYLYNTSGKLLKKLTSGDWVVTKFYGFSPDEQYAFFQATKESPIERHIYKVNLNSGEITKLTDVQGVHEAFFSSDMEYFVDKYSNLTTPNNIEIRTTKKPKKIATILKAPNPLAGYAMPEVKIGTIKAADKKTDLYYRLILPPNFDENKKYPVLVYVYGGPHVQLITNSWLADAQLWLIYMAQQGFVVFTLDNRGSYNRGFKFESVTFRHLGLEEAKDQMEGIKFLQSLKYVDTSKFAIHGWSFGGYMTLTMLTLYPNIFKVGVAGGAVTDWKLYEVMYGERYMDTPEDNPEGYEKTAIAPRIEKLKAKTLLIHGMADPVVVPQHTLSLLIEAQNKGIQLDYYPYPLSEHGVRYNYRPHLYKKMTQYIFDNLHLNKIAE